MCICLFITDALWVRELIGCFVQTKSYWLLAVVGGALVHYHGATTLY